jgi:hypothetical protein
MSSRVWCLLVQLLLVLAVFTRGEEVAQAGEVAESDPAAVSDGFSSEIYVCEAAEHAFLGTYVASNTHNDGAPVYNNANDMSFFRNKGFWYIGNLE